jgi:hypothetical protein
LARSLGAGSWRREDSGVLRLGLASRAGLLAYAEATLPKQFDAFVWFDETRTVTPLGPEAPDFCGAGEGRSRDY